MIASLTFSNFKSIAEPVTLSFEATKSTELESYYVVQATPRLRLLKMAMIYGANASGKSNVLEALNFLRQLVVDSALKKTDAITYNRFAFDAVKQSGQSTFQLSFVADGTRFDYSVTLNPQYVVEESLHFYQPNRALVFTRTTDPEARLARIEFGSKMKLYAEERRVLETSTLWNATVLGSYLKVNIQQPYLQSVTDWFSVRLGALITPADDLYERVTYQLLTGTVAKESVVQLLRKADFNIEGIDIESTNPFSKDTKSLSGLVRFQHGVRSNNKKSLSSLPYELQSMGTQRFYQMAGVLANLIGRSGITVFDEIESSLHPDLLKFYLLLFLRNSQQSQLIFTTHQRDLLQEHEMLRPDVIHFTEKGEDGSTDLFALTDFDSSVYRKGGSIYNVYKSGKVGAVPEFEDAYIPVD